MPALGAHMSVAGGLHKAFYRIKKVGGEALQIFTRNQRQWKAAQLSKAEIDSFRTTQKLVSPSFLCSHASYLINLASWQDEIAKRSLKALAEELDRCRRLSIPYLVLHPGSHGGQGPEVGLNNVVKNLDRAISLAGLENSVNILIETTAGQGTSLGSDFTELRYILSHSSFPERLSVCVDTCHIFAAGYDIGSRKGYEGTIEELDRVVGLDKVHLFHLNDSKRECGSRVDRHEHIGSGKIGLSGFRFLLNDSRFSNHPMILETPKGKDLKEDIQNLETLRRLVN